MATRLTTICCSALALTAAYALTAAAQITPSSARRVKQTFAANDKTPQALFPLQTLWTISLNNGLTAPPAFDATRGFFPIEGDQMAAYDLTSGMRIWVISFRTKIEPAAGDDRLFVAGSGILAALRATDGSSAWELPFAETLAVPPVWDNGWLVGVTTTGEVLAFRGSDGTLIWRRNIGATAHARPTLSDDHIYLPTNDSRVVALRVDTGAPVWERRLGGAANDILAIDGRLYLGSQDRYLYCLNSDSGLVEWRWQTGGDAIGLPVVDARSVFFVSLDNVLRALNRSSGVQRWKSALPLRPAAGPIKAADAIIVAGPAPTLRAYKTQDGTGAGEVSMPGELAAPPHLFAPASRSLPIVIAVTTDIIKGTSVVALTRSFEPAVVPLAPLPNPIALTPQAIARPRSFEPAIVPLTPLPNPILLTPPMIPPAPP